MSIHKSLRLGNSLERRRSVLKRAERMEKMLAEGRLADADSVFGLPKLRVIVKVAKKKKKEAAAVEGVEGAPVEAGAAAPAAAAPAAAPDKKADKKADKKGDKK
jgi:small basic protein (TIGR04137 family)